MNPSLIQQRNRRFEAYNQDGRMILQRTKRFDCLVTLNNYGYFTVTAWSRCGKTILEKVKGARC